MVKYKKQAAGLALAIGLLTVATTLFGVWRHFTPVPLGDSWDGTVGFYVRAITDPWHAFFEQHNEHRLTFSRLIFFADVRYFGGRNVFSLIANLVLAGLLCLTFCKVALHSQPKMPTWSKVGLAGVTMALTFSWLQQENFTWGFQSQWYAVYLFALLAFHSLERVEQLRTNANNWLVISILSATIAAYSMSAGLLVFPVLFIQAVYLRLNARKLFAIALGGIAVWCAYFNGWNPVSNNGGVKSLLLHPLDAARYVLLYLGSPANGTLLGTIGAYVCGIVMLAAVLMWSLRALRSRATPPIAIAFLAFAIFIVLNAAATTSGRLWMGLDTALASRYTTASLTGWLAMLIFSALNTKISTAQRPILAAAVCAMLIVAVAQRLALHSDFDLSWQRMVGGLATREQVYDLAVTRPVYPFPDRLAKIVPIVRAARISIFADDQHDYASPPPRITIGSTCEGYVDGISHSETSDMYIVRGWIYDTSTRRVPHNIVVTAPDGRSIGIGLTGGERDDVVAQLGDNARFSGWIAFIHRPPEGLINITAATMSGTYCALRGSHPIAPH
ncbi:hypothetical protein [Paraburkholderia guartelaensis]|uniref:Transmembrane protein n=1 Tax=Paraburkholderia guartelaensis TaxID=2546446 RepID=A0ABU9SGS9_9BURK